VLLFAIALLLYTQRSRLSDWLPAPSVPEFAPQVAPADQPVPRSAGPAGSISAAGYLEVIPPGPAVVSTLIAGRVLEIAVIAGQSVQKGQVLARLDPGPLSQEAAVLNSRVELARSRLARQRAGFRSEEIERAEAALQGRQARLAQATADWERAEQLFGSGVIARQELDARQAAREQAGADAAAAEAELRLLRAGTRSEDLAIAEAELAAAQAELGRVQWELAQCTVRASDDGVVLEQYSQPGDWVTPGTDNPRSGALMSIFDPRQLQAWVDVNQRDSGSLFVGQQAELTTDALPDRPVAAYIERIMPQANLQKNTVQVKLAIPEPPADFRPELSVKVLFLPPDDEPNATPVTAPEEATDV